MTKDESSEEDEEELTEEEKGEITINCALVLVVLSCDNVILHYYYYYYYYSHLMVLLLLHPFNGLFCGTSWVSQLQKGVLDFTGARDNGGSIRAAAQVKRVHLCKSNYVKIIPTHMLIREIIPGRQQRVRWCPL